MLLEKLLYLNYLGSQLILLDQKAIALQRMRPDDPKVEKFALDVLEARVDPPSETSRLFFLLEDQLFCGTAEEIEKDADEQLRAVSQILQEKLNALKVMERLVRGVI